MTHDRVPTTDTPQGVRRLNHAVLYVADAEVSASFYCDILGFTVAHRFAGAFFLRAAHSPNDHDLGLFSIGHRGGGPTRAGIGLYHLAWQVDTIEELAAMRARLLAAGSLVGESDHGVSKSLYAQDPDGIEFEVMWAVPSATWDGRVGTDRLDLPAELARWAATPTLRESNC